MLFGLLNRKPAASEQVSSLKDVAGKFAKRVESKPVITPIPENALPCERGQPVAESSPELDAEYPRIDLSFLSWTKRGKILPIVPRFATFRAFEKGVHEMWFSGFDSAGNTFSMWGTSTTDKEESVQGSPILSIYHEWAHSFRSDKRGVVLSCAFSGLIPEDVRNKIYALKSKVDQTYIITEADWDEKRVPDIDPLVIVRKGKHHWLVATFDLSPLEHVVASEYTI